MSTLLAVFETSGIIDTITSVIGTLLYPLFSIIFVLIAGVQHVFFAFAGIDKMSYGGKPITNGNSGADDDTGIVYYLMRNDIVKNLIMSIMLLALFLVIIFTVMAFIKNVYSSKPKGWKEIIGNAIKGLANFIFLPVCCLLGVWLGNILLQAINGATSYKGATSMERKLFIACSYNANLFRCDETPDVTWAELKALADNTMISDSSKTFAQYHGLSFPTDTKELNSPIITATSSDEDRNYYAELVDQIFSETNVNLNAWGINAKILVTDTGTGEVGSFNTYLGVGSFYSLWQVNYLVLIVGGIFMLYVLGSLAFAMVRRLFLILVLFIVSPAVCAMYPLDEGKAVGSWKSKFIEQVLSAYGAVAGLNIFFSLVPLIDKISIFDGTGWYGGWGINDIVQIFILVVGLMVVKEFISLITSFVGGEDAYGKGSGLMKGAAKEVGGRAGKFAVKTTGAFARAKAVQDATGRGFFRSLVGSAGEGLKGTGKNMLKTLTGGALDIDAMEKEAKDARKDGLEHPNKRQEERIERYGENRSNREFRRFEQRARRTIANAGNDRISNDNMAAVLRQIQDKEAKRRVAAMFAEHNNAVIMEEGTRGTTTIEKVLEAEDKVLQEESRRQDAYGAQTDLSGSFDASELANTQFADFATTSGISYDESTGIFSGVTETSQSDLESMRIAAEAAGAGSREEDTYKNAVKANEDLAKFKELMEKQKSALKQLKQAALNFASGLEKLAENYNGNTKSTLKDQANAVKSVVNSSSADWDSINTAISDARTELAALGRDGTEIINTLDTGSR